jgi:hypothetical protein
MQKAFALTQHAAPHDLGRFAAGAGSLDNSMKEMLISWRSHTINCQTMAAAIITGEIPSSLIAVFSCATFTVLGQ